MYIREYIKTCTLDKNIDISQAENLKKFIESEYDYYTQFNRKEVSVKNIVAFSDKSCLVVFKEEYN